MDLYNDPNRFRTLRPLSPTEERFFGVPPHAPLLENRTSVESTELIEEDVLFSDYDYTEPSSSSSPIPFGPPDSFGILTALPVNDASPNGRNGSKFLHKAPVSVSLSASVSSSSSSSSSRAILAIPRSSSYRTLSSSLSRFPQSAPVNVPMMSPAMIRLTRKFKQEEDEMMEEKEEEEKETMPPHEYVTKKLTLSSMLSCSVLEGVGRTLKGRDLRQVRNAVLHQTASDFRMGNCKSIKTLLKLKEYEIEELINNGSVL